MNLKDLAASSKSAGKKHTLSITEERRGPICVLHFAGDLDLKTLPKAKQAMGDLLGDEPPATTGKNRPRKGSKGAGGAIGSAAVPLRLVIDLEGVEYIDSSGLGFFIGTLKRLKELKGDLKLARLNAYMMGIFKLINMHYVVDVFDDVEKAVNSFTSQRRAVQATSGMYKE